MLNVPIWNTFFHNRLICTIILAIQTTWNLWANEIRQWVRFGAWFKHDFSVNFDDFRFARRYQSKNNIFVLTRCFSSWMHTHQHESCEQRCISRWFLRDMHWKVPVVPQSEKNRSCEFQFKFWQNFQKVGIIMQVQSWNKSFGCCLLQSLVNLELMEVRNKMVGSLRGTPTFQGHHWTKLHQQFGTSTAQQLKNRTFHGNERYMNRSGSIKTSWKSGQSSARAPMMTARNAMKNVIQRWVSTILQNDTLSLPANVLITWNAGHCSNTWWGLWQQRIVCQ